MKFYHFRLGHGLLFLVLFWYPLYAQDHHEDDEVVIEAPNKNVFIFEEEDSFNNVSSTSYRTIDAGAFRIIDLSDPIEAIEDIISDDEGEDMADINVQYRSDSFINSENLHEDQSADEQELSHSSFQSTEEWTEREDENEDLDELQFMEEVDISIIILHNISMTCFYFPPFFLIDTAVTKGGGAGRASLGAGDIAGQPTSEAGREQRHRTRTNSNGEGETGAIENVFGSWSGYTNETWRQRDISRGKKHHRKSQRSLRDPYRLRLHTKSCSKQYKYCCWE
jgi:hypothetical protein